LNQLPPKWYSHGSAMANTMQQISASIGTAFLVTLVAMGTKNASVIQGLSERQAQLTGFEWAFMGSTLLALFAFILSMFLSSTKEEKVIVRRIHGQELLLLTLKAKFLVNSVTL